MSDRGFPTVVWEKKTGAGKESIKLIAWWFNVTDHLPWEWSLIEILKKKKAIAQQQTNRESLVEN